MIKKIRGKILFIPFPKNKTIKLICQRFRFNDLKDLFEVDIFEYQQGEIF
jgi:hypothetical protein